VPYQDLRSFVAKLEEEGELRRIQGAHWELEIGAISELSFERNGPALLFEQIPGYPSEYRVLSNLCSTVKRSLLAIDMPVDLSLGEAMERWREFYRSYRPIPPAKAGTALFRENMLEGQDVDLLRFPVPKWHEKDGGRYIGTGCMVILQDPESGAVNVGTYRLMVHDRNTTGMYQGPGNDGIRIIQKYWARGRPCPVAITLGQEPVIFLTSCGRLGCPSGVPEYDFAGAIRKEPVEVVEGELTGLPIPATAEIVLEGIIPPVEVERKGEGPFGEYTGYYMGGTVPQPVVKIKRLYHRNDSILLGAPPFKPVSGHYASPLPFRLVTGLWSRLDKAGIQGIRAIRDLANVGGVVISLRQQDEGHVERVIAALEKSPIQQRLLVLVDDDVNVDDEREVLWAMGTRMEPATGTKISTIETDWVFNPMLTLEQRQDKPTYPFSRLIVDACRPYRRLGEFPPVNLFSEERRREVAKKWRMDEWLGGSED
jgi:4-hydroxy-3-polyprenylbenzoate decarboxylase